MASTHAIGLCGEGITTVTPGAALLLRGERIELGGATKQRYAVPIVVALTASGAAGSTGTAQIEVSADNSSWVVWGTAWSVTINSAGTPQLYGNAPLVGKLLPPYDYIRVNVTAVSGVTFQGWIKRRD